MKSNLSATKFVKNNKRQVGVMLIALALTFMTMYIINFLLMTTEESFKRVVLEQPEKMAKIMLSAETMGIDVTEYDSDEMLNEAVTKRREEIVAQLEALDGIKKAYYCQMLNGRYRGIVGELGTLFPLLAVEEVPAYLEYTDAKLIGGRLPEADGEILVDQKMLQNQKLKIGDHYLTSFWGNTFTVVGVLESEGMICVGVPMGYSNSGWYFTVLCNEDSADMRVCLEKLGITVTDYDNILDIREGEKTYEEEICKVLDVSVLGILVVVMIFLAISILVAYISFVRNRRNEYCLYVSIGFGRNEVYGMMMRELGIIFGTSLLLGVVLTLILMKVVSVTVLDQMGLVYRYWYPRQILRILASFMGIVGIMQFPIIATIQNIKTIDRIEDQ